jgi:hypothetical protein
MNSEETRMGTIDPTPVAGLPAALANASIAPDNTVWLIVITVIVALALVFSIINLAVSARIGRRMR